MLFNHKKKNLFSINSLSELVRGGLERFKMFARDVCLFLHQSLFIRRDLDAAFLLIFFGVCSRDCELGSRVLC